MNNFCTFYIVRHGESKDNANGILAGHTDNELTETGKAQALERAQDFKDFKFDAVFSSDLARARQTAEIARVNHELVVNTKEIIRERNFGEFEGKTIEEYVQLNRDIIERLKDATEAEKMDFKPYDSYESNNEASSRMLTFLREIAVSYPGKTVLIVSHGAIIRSTMMRLGFYKYHELPSLSVSNLAYFKIRSDGTDFFLEETKGVNI
jgi:broad specificity phosphatase PhoE